MQGYIKVLNSYSQLEHIDGYLKAECLHLEHYCFT